MPVALRPTSDFGVNKGTPVCLERVLFACWPEGESRLGKPASPCDARKRGFAFLCRRPPRGALRERGGTARPPWKMLGMKLDVFILALVLAP